MIKFLSPFLSVLGSIVHFFKIPSMQGGFIIRFPSFMTRPELAATLFGGYEKHERKLIKKYLDKNDSVLELGACIGVVALTINKILTDKTKQVSVEPNPQMLPFLTINRKCNGGKFVIETCIVSKLPEVTFFIGGTAFLGSSTLGGGQKTLIKGKTLNDLVSEYFDFTALIMDIEGGELDFFKSFDLKNSKIRLIVWETHCKPHMLSEKELHECYDLLINQGYKFIEKSGDVEAWNRII